MLVFCSVIVICLLISIKLKINNDWDYKIQIFFVMLMGVFAGFALSIICGLIFTPEPTEKVELTPVIVDNEIYYKNGKSLTKYNGKVLLTDKDYMYIDVEKYDAKIFFVVDKSTLMVPAASVGKNE